MVALTVSLNEVILAACMTAVTLTILGATLLMFKRAAPSGHAMHGPRPPRPAVACADADVLQSWFGALQAAPTPRPARPQAPACPADNGTGRVVPLFDASRSGQGPVERRCRERRAS